MARKHDVDTERGFSEKNEKYDNEDGVGVGEQLPEYDARRDARRKSMAEGELKYKKLGWKKLTVCLIVEAIALGSLSLPSVFATLGMVAGVLITVGLGLTAIYTGHIVGQVKLKYPKVSHYADAVGLIGGKIGYEIASVMFVLLLVLLVGGHVLTGTIAWIEIVSKPSICALVFGFVSAILLFVLALPPSFAEFAILGYIDFASIIIAIGITIIAAGIEGSNAPGGLSNVSWSAMPPKGTTFAEAFLSVTNVVFAYSFAVTQFSFMEEMGQPKDYMKSIWALGIMEILIYTLTGALIYSFVGNEVESPALLSIASTPAKVAFGIALPVIFISGSINSVVVGRYILGRAFPHSEIKYVNTKKGWIVWIGLIAVITLVAWVVAEAIPFFNDLLGIISSLFISGFSFYFPALFWFMLLKEGSWKSGKNLYLSILNGLLLVIGVLIFFGGAYSSIKDILDAYKSGSVGGSFTCDQKSYLEG